MRCKFPIFNLFSVEMAGSCRSIVAGHCAGAMRRPAGVPQGAYNSPRVALTVQHHHSKIIFTFEVDTLVQQQCVSSLNA